MISLVLSLQLTGCELAWRGHEAEYDISAIVTTPDCVIEVRRIEGRTEDSKKSKTKTTPGS